MTDLTELSLWETARMIRAGEISPVEAVDAALDKIARDDELAPFVEVLNDEAREDARRSAEELERGEPRGPLHGVPIAIKDIIDCAGVPTRNGSRASDPAPRVADAPVVERIRRAGGIIVGKTTTGEFAYTMTSPPTRNARDSARSPGGSSGGSAVAVAAGMCAAALGTDTGGSVRIPAAMNGVVGFKPTYGRLPKSGVTPLAWSLDTVGTLTRTVADAALMLEVTAGRDRGDPTSSREPVGELVSGLEETAPLRIGVPTAYFRGEVDPDVEVTLTRAVELMKAMGHTVIEDLELTGLDHALEIQFGILFAEAASYHQDTLRERAELLTADVRANLELGEMYLAAHYVNAQRARAQVKCALRDTYEGAGLDAMVLPAIPRPAPFLDEDGSPRLDATSGDTVTRFVRLTAPFSLSGQPSLSVPLGTDSDGMPLAVSVVGRPFAERTVLRLGHQLQS